MSFMDTSALADFLGVSTSVLSFLVAFLCSLPLSYGIRFIETSSLRHVYSFFSGAALCWAAYGGLSASLRLLFPILFTYGAMVLSRRYCGYIVFFGSFSYLISCHVSHLSGSRWREGGMDYTGTLMVLTLKITACAINYQDGRLPDEKASHRMYVNRLKNRPSLLEFLGHNYFPGSILVGPLHELKDYHAFIERKDVWNPKVNQGPKFFHPALKVFSRAALALAVYQLLNSRFPDSFLIDPKFLGLSFLQRCVHIFLVTFSHRWKYHFIWSIAETSMILSGLAFTGWSKTKPEEPEWDRGRNVDIRKMELEWSASQFPTHWNISVGQWLRTYVYERLSFVSGRNGLWNLVATQSVSAIWHGIYPGYFLFFINCATAQDVSKKMYKMYTNSPDLPIWKKRIFVAGQFLFGHICLNYSQVGFILLRADQTLIVWKSVYFLGTVLPIGTTILVSFLKPKKERTKKSQ